MSQVKLNLQPPPNVDFVTGYPGIPPGPDRPQASVRGAIEVRVPPQGVKAKWVRIELRKVETLPGGGPANTFYDFVGPSPVNLWSSSDEYGLLRSQDFPFSIRIPESIPPTIALDNRAGIGYELVASVCTKGKRGFLRKAKSVVSSTIAPIIIDKHELHSTWPVYQQPETRHLAQDGVNLIVERNHNCYGPGDRVVVVATVKSDSLHTVILRGFEMFLKEATVFRAGVHSAGKKNAPQVRQINIAETKAAVNATLYGGTAHTAELSCMISANHTTTTLNAARHIDVTYTLCIKALMGTGTHLIMDLPVIISNWQRHVSHEAINRIGPAPSLSLLPPSIPGAAPVTRVDPTRNAPSATLPINRTNVDTGGFGHTRNASASAYNTLPVTSTAPADDVGYGAGYGLGRPTNGLVDEFGSNRPAISTNPNATATGSGSTAAPGLTNASSLTSNIRRPNSSGGGNRFIIKNGEPQDGINRQRSAQALGSGSGSAANQWPTAEDEKITLYEKARANVAKVQGVAASPPPAVLGSQSVTASPPRGAAAPAISSPTKNAWLTAEEEKQRLFLEAQAAVARNTGVQPVNAIGGSNHTRGDSDPKAQSSSGSGSKPSTGAALYAQAISARSGASSAQAGGSSAPSPSAKTVPQYLTAEQEKAALRRYEEARRAVDRSQNTSAEETAPPVTHSGPIAYDSLFPEASRGGSVPSQAAATAPPADAPPPFDSAPGGSNIMAHLSEKERLRRAYEAQDAARQNLNPSPPPPAAYTAPAPAPAPAPKPATSSLPGQYANALEEKEALRRKFEARDNAKAQPVRANPPPSPPARNNSVSTSPANPGGSSAIRSPSANASGFRPTPVPPGAVSPTKVLTAAEEKALLRAKYDARDSGARKPPTVVTSGNPSANGSGAHMTTPVTPPPLMPRPPVEYIKETQEEDARLSRINGQPPKLNGSSSSSSLNKSASGASALDMKPFTPFRAGFDPSITNPGPPPPLPSKPAE